MKILKKLAVEERRIIKGCRKRIARGHGGGKCEQKKKKTINVLGRRGTQTEEWESKKE